METYVLFFLASIAAGVINALAGGGGLITFPLLMLVVSPVTADATSAVALLPAIRPQFGVRAISWLASCVAAGFGCFWS